MPLGRKTNRNPGDLKKRLALKCSNGSTMPNEEKARSRGSTLEKKTTENTGGKGEGRSIVEGTPLLGSTWTVRKVIGKRFKGAAIPEGAGRINVTSALDGGICAPEWKSLRHHSSPAEPELDLSARAGVRCGSLQSWRKPGGG